ncbi:hypothetical protein EVAR_73744_1 [Eumeta japonica]|uniref:Uncharacterized protein n=1 Tax=Eumeta variegata TaxID=151549 RepID=A0A4C1TMZ1_EUMVA|nr:hypothetical protein EVAR_73744_1 [Eumeta japonica]
MPEESKENKAKKLAAARKKFNAVTSYGYADSSTNSGHLVAIYQRSESELQLNGSVTDANNAESTKDAESLNAVQLEAVNYFANEQTVETSNDLELEELRVQHGNATKRVDDLTLRMTDLQKQQDQHKLHNAELQHKLAEARAQQEDHSSHINELKLQLTLRDERLKQLDADFKDKCSNWN